MVGVDSTGALAADDGNASGSVSRLDHGTTTHEAHYLILPAFYEFSYSTAPRSLSLVADTNDRIEQRFCSGST